LNGRVAPEDTVAFKTLIANVGRDMLSALRLLRLLIRQADQHLAHNLAMRLVKGSEKPTLVAQFRFWLARYVGCVNVHPAGPNFLNSSGVALSHFTAFPCQLEAVFAGVLRPMLYLGPLFVIP
jgi:hypothetical protein